MDPLEFVTSLVAMVLVAVTFWILLLRKNRHGVSVEPAEEYDLQELATMAESLKQRIDILESILDAEVPDWRDQNEVRHD
jgi:phage shock protein B